MLGDILLYKDGAFGAVGSRKANVDSGAVASIKAGELVLKSLGSPFVVVWTAGNTAKPVVTSDFIAGLSATTSTDTATATGTVEIIPLVAGQQFLGNPDVPATWGLSTTPVQATYDALVGDRVLLKTSAGGVQTLLSTDNSTYGLVVEPKSVYDQPGKVAFSIRKACSYLA